MAHFAEIGKGNEILRVVVVNNNDMLDSNGVEQEYLGSAFCKKLLGGFDWVQTSYNGTIRKNFAGPGFTYNKTRDAFIPPQPEGNYMLDSDTCLWVLDSA